MAVNANCDDSWLMELRSLNVWSPTNYTVNDLSKGERDRYQGFTRDARKKEYLYSRVLLRELLGQLCPTHEGQWVVAPQGPVEVLGDNNIWASISHSGGWIGVAVSRNGRIGIDIELPKLRTDWLALAERYFPTIEYEWLKVLAEDEGKRAFYELWTYKEAYLKAQGLDFHEGYLLLEQRSLEAVPCEPSTGQPPEGWCLDRKWEGEVAISVYRELLGLT